MQTLDSPTFVEHWLMLQEKRQKFPDLFALRSTGIPSLDLILGGGVEFGQFVVYGGQQKIGKSTLLQHTAQAFGDHGDCFLFLSAEMDNMSIGNRVFSNISGVDKNRIRRGEITVEDWTKLREAGDQIKDWHGWWNYGFATIGDIVGVLKKIKQDTGIFVRTIFVDYFQLMEHPGKGGRVDQLSAISRAFKRMSIEMEEPMLVFVTAQLNRQSIRGHIIDANSFLGTGALERDMDIGVIIHEAKDELSGRVMDNVKQLTVVGSRDTDTGSTYVTFVGATATIRDKPKALAKVNLDHWSGDEDE
jgi:replicative DNA helicase